MRLTRGENVKYTFSPLVNKPGNQVWAYNQQTKKMELEVVRHLWVNHDNDLVDLTLTTKIPASKGKPAQLTSETVHTNNVTYLVQ